METLLLAVYFLVVLYVLYQMSLSLEDRLEDKVDIFVDEKTLNEQTQAQLVMQKNAKNITAQVQSKIFSKDSKVKRPVLALVFDADKEFPVPPEMLLGPKNKGISMEALQEMMHSKIIIRIAPTNKEKLRKIPFITVSVWNDTGDTQVYINWDRSSLEMFGQGNRVVRIPPNVIADLTQSQVSTVINPGMTVTSNITTEQKYIRNTDTALLRANPLPVVDLKERIDMSRLTDPKSAEENIQSLYTLDLMVGIKHTTKPDYDMINLLIPFIFKMKIEVDQPAFPPMRWWLKHFGRRRPSKGNWFWGSQAKNGQQDPKF
jgi:hypothetical protein